MKKVFSKLIFILTVSILFSLIGIKVGYADTNVASNKYIGRSYPNTFENVLDIQFKKGPNTDLGGGSYERCK